MSTFSLMNIFIIKYKSIIVSGEPSAPKLEGQMGEDGNSIKVNVIKQDDGGSPIRHYLIKYKAVSMTDNSSLICI